MSRSTLCRPYVLGQPYVGSTFRQVDVVSGRPFVSQPTIAIQFTSKIQQGYFYPQEMMSQHLNRYIIEYLAANEYYPNPTCNPFKTCYIQALMQHHRTLPIKILATSNKQQGTLDATVVKAADLNLSVQGGQPY